MPNESALRDCITAHKLPGLLDDNLSSVCTSPAVIALVLREVRSLTNERMSEGMNERTELTHEMSRRTELTHSHALLSLTLLSTYSSHSPRCAKRPDPSFWPGSSPSRSCWRPRNGPSRPACSLPPSSSDAWACRRSTRKPCMLSMNRRSRKRLQPFPWPLRPRACTPDLCTRWLRQVARECYLVLFFLLSCYLFLAFFFQRALLQSLISPPPIELDI